MPFEYKIVFAHLSVLSTVSHFHSLVVLAISLIVCRTWRECLKIRLKCLLNTFFSSCPYFCEKLKTSLKQDSEYLQISCFSYQPTVRISFTPLRNLFATIMSFLYSNVHSTRAKKSLKSNLFSITIMFEIDRGK